MVRHELAHLARRPPEYVIPLLVTWLSFWSALLFVVFSVVPPRL